MTVTLIGMPGSGKSCLGRSLSRKLKIKNIDGDKLIEQVTGRKLQDIINQDGLDKFKEIEEEVLLSINDDDVVISPGGSAVYYESVMKHFKELGVVVYLYVSPKVIIERLGDFSKRGIALKEGQTIFDLYNERAPLFEKYADLTIDCDGRAFSKYQSQLYKAITDYKAKKQK